MATTLSRPPVVRFADFGLDLRSGELSRNGDRLLLPDQPFRLLAILLRERGALVTREDLRHELWPEDLCRFRAEPQRSRQAAARSPRGFRHGDELDPF